jgi:hypothetical protein
MERPSTRLATEEPQTHKFQPVPLRNPGGRRPGFGVNRSRPFPVPVLAGSPNEFVRGGMTVIDCLPEPVGPTTGTVHAGNVRSLLAAGDRAFDEDGDLDAGRRWFDLAFRAAEAAGDREAMAEAALGSAGLWVHEQRTSGPAATTRARLRHALSIVEPRSTLALRLRARLAAEADYRDGRHTTIVGLLDEARLSADPVAHAEAVSLAHHCVLGPDHSALRRTLADELVEVSIRTGRRGHLLMGVMWQTVDLLLDGDRHAERRLAELRGLLAQSDHHAVGYVGDAIDVMLAIRSGRLDKAEVMARECAARGAAAGDADATGWYGAQLVTVRWYQGRLVELLPMLRQLVHSPTLSVVDNSYLAALAVAWAQAGDRRAAAGALAQLRGRDWADLPRSSSWLVAMSGAVEAAALLDDVDTAERVYALMAPHADLPMMASLGVTCFGSVQHALGLAALTAGHLDRAVEHLRAAVEDNLALGHRPAGALARLRYAQALTRRAGRADVAAARHELGAASAEFDALGLAAPTECAGPSEPARCIREGRDWRIELGGRGVVVAHSVGMLHLAVLMANPEVEIPAIELVAGIAGMRRADGRGASAQPMLDRVAMLRYRDRLSQLTAEIEQYESSGQEDRAARAETERDWLLSELSTATGIGGRIRTFADSDERARLATSRAIRRAIARVAGADSVIGAHLHRSVYTGMRCSYRPA